MRKFDKYVEGEKNILIIASRPFDRDCIGTGLVLKKYLESLNKKVRLVFPGEPTEEEKEQFKFLPYFDELEFKDTRQYFLKKTFDVVIFIDGANLAQFYNTTNSNTNPPDINIYNKRIHIDHHLLQPEKLGVFHIHEPKAAATAEILIKDIVPKSFVDAKIATLAYAAIAEDTGNFKWNFTSETLKVASFLIERGARFLEIIDQIYTSKPSEYLKMLSFALDKAKYNLKLKAIFLFIPHSVFKKEKFDNFEVKELTKAFSLELAGKIKDIDRGILIYEQEKGVVEVRATGNNLRNKINLPKMLTELGGNGGGHFNACGTTIYGNYYQAKKRLIKLLEKSVK